MTRPPRRTTAAATAAIILTTLLTSTTASPAQTQTGAVLTEKGTTITAHSVPSTTGLAVIDGKTYSFRGPGLTLSNGDVVSVLFDGIGDEKTTVTYGNLVTQQVPSITEHNPLTIISASTILGGATSGSVSTISITGSDTTAPSGARASPSTASSSASASASSSTESSNMGTTQSIGGGKVVALVGALAAVVLCGL